VEVIGLAYSNPSPTFIINDAEIRISITGKIILKYLSKKSKQRLSFNSSSSMLENTGFMRNRMTNKLPIKRAALTTCKNTIILAKEPKNSIKNSCKS